MYSYHLTYIYISIRIIIYLYIKKKIGGVINPGIHILYPKSQEETYIKATSCILKLL